MDASQQCIFCQIAQGKINAQKVYEDADFTVVLDINPANPGHCLLLTKTHYQVMPQVPDEIVAKMMDIAKKISHAALAALKAQGTTIFVANGAPAGQRAPHFMLHVIPRVAGDGVELDIPLKDYSLAEANEARKKLQERIAQVFEFRPVMEAIPAQQPQKDITVVAEQIPPRPPVRSTMIEKKSPETQFIWQKQTGAHLEIKDLPIYDSAHVTRFFSLHKELIAVVDALVKSGPMHAIELQRIVDFRIKHLLALEYLGYIRPLGEKDPLRHGIDSTRIRNHPGRTFYAATRIGRMLLEDPVHPPILANAIKEKIILEEMGSAPEQTQAQIEKNPSQEKFDLDRLAELLGGK